MYQIFIISCLFTICLCENFVGTCGKSETSCKYSFEETTGKMTISGNGVINDGDVKTEKLWENFLNKIISVEISNVVTSFEYG